MSANDLPRELGERQVQVGMTIDHGSYSGVVVGINSRDLVMQVRVTSVARHAPPSLLLMTLGDHARSRINQRSVRSTRSRLPTRRSASRRCIG